MSTQSVSEQGIESQEAGCTAAQIRAHRIMLVLCIANCFFPLILVFYCVVRNQLEQLSVYGFRWVALTLILMGVASVKRGDALLGRSIVWCPDKEAVLARLKVIAFGIMWWLVAEYVSVM